MIVIVSEVGATARCCVLYSRRAAKDGRYRREKKSMNFEMARAPPNDASLGFFFFCISAALLRANTGSERSKIAQGFAGGLCHHAGSALWTILHARGESLGPVRISTEDAGVPPLRRDMRSKCGCEQPTARLWAQLSPCFPCCPPNTTKCPTAAPAHT